MPANVRKKLKEDALEWARLVYKMYKEDKRAGKIPIGQNDAKTSKS